MINILIIIDLIIISFSKNIIFMMRMNSSYKNWN